jgi:hypothetical protein
MTWSGAGHTQSWVDQAGPNGDTHWYNITRNERYGVEVGETSFLSLSSLWVKAIQYPGKSFTVRWKQGTGPGSDCFSFAFYDHERKQVLAGLYDCPHAYGHHLYQTCKCCGQYG